MHPKTMQQARSASLTRSLHKLLMTYHATYLRPMLEVEAAQFPTAAKCAKAAGDSNLRVSREASSFCEGPVLTKLRTRSATLLTA